MEKALSDRQALELVTCVARRCTLAAEAAKDNNEALLHINRAMDGLLLLAKGYSLNALAEEFGIEDEES